MASRVGQRDGECWVSRFSGPLINSHICPKRMGDDLARIIYTTFTSTAHSPNLSIYDEVCGPNLSSSLDPFFDSHSLGSGD
ncbi:hypothetical protein CPB85DRAFT_1493583 [Mucidula mucida]|nr:hypothetical protein CPB85DRAFT_1493583 [Mucidula mucida]